MAITHEDAVKAIVKSYIANEFVWEDDIVKLSGRFACHINNPGTVSSLGNIAANIHVEVKSIDKDTPQLRWVRFNDLKVIRDAMT